MCSVMSDSLRCHKLQLARLFCLWDSPGKKYWSRLPFPPPGDLLQGIFPTQELNLCLFRLMHWQEDSLLLHYLESPICYLYYALFIVHILIICIYKCIYIYIYTHIYSSCRVLLICIYVYICLDVVSIGYDLLLSALFAQVYILNPSLPMNIVQYHFKSCYSMAMRFISLFKNFYSQHLIFGLSVCYYR